MVPAAPPFPRKRGNNTPQSISFLINRTKHSAAKTAADRYLLSFSLLTTLTEILRFAQDDCERWEEAPLTSVSGCQTVPNPQSPVSTPQFPLPSFPYPTSPLPLYIPIKKFHRFPSRNLISLKSPLFYEYQHFSNYPAGERKIRMAEGRILSIPFSCHLVYDYLRYNILCLYFYF